MTRIAFLSAGAPRHGQNFTVQVQGLADKAGYGWECSFLEWQADGYESYPLTEYDWLWNVGNFGNFFFWLSQKHPKPKTIAMWIGTDILQHRDIISQGMDDPFYAAPIHIADAPNLVQEARELTGLDVGYFRSIPPAAYESAPIERWDRILAYIPQGREDFFRWDIVREVAKDYPDIEFHIIGRTEALPDSTSNVRIIPEIRGEPKDALFRSCFALLRPCIHDGVGLTLIEMAQFNRFVFHTDTRIPHVVPARSAGEIEFWLDTILSKRKPPHPFISNYYRSEYAESKLADDLDRLRGKMENAMQVP